MGLCRPKAGFTHDGTSMSQQRDSHDERPLQVTPRMLVEVSHGRGTPAEDRLVREALKDPNSAVHDWLEQMQDWAESVFGLKAPSSKAADRIIDQAMAKAHYHDVIAFLQNKTISGGISHEEVARIIRVGGMTADQDHQPSAWREGIQRMVGLLSELRPLLASELIRLQRDHTKRDGGLDR